MAVEAKDTDSQPQMVIVAMGQAVPAMGRKLVQVVQVETVRPLELLEQQAQQVQMVTLLMVLADLLVELLVEL